MIIQLCNNVYSNIFSGSWAAIGFVGAVRSRVFNNTFYKPENWVFRILQESVDTSRFYPCGQNEFSNNIVYFGNSLHNIVNIGPNTEPQSFTFSNNLWYNYENENFNDPQLPVTETNPVIQMDPMFFDAENLNFEISTQSPALSSGKNFTDVLDYNLRYFSDSTCIGAFQTNGIYKDFTGDVGTEWVYDEQGIKGYNKLYILEKLIESNKEYSVIAQDYYGNDLISTLYQFFTTDNKVYYKQTDETGTPVENDTFHLLIDYNLKVGDNFEFYNPYDNFIAGCNVIIYLVRFEYVAGKVRKIFYGTGVGPEFIDFGVFLNCGNPAKFMEGIHSINIYMFGNTTFIAQNYIDDSQTFDALRCYKYPDENGDMQTVHFTDYDCLYTVGTADLPDPFIQVYPIPAFDNINFEFRFSFSGNIDIYDISGNKLMGTGFILQNVCSIDISSLKTGVYLAKIYNNDITVMKKLLVIHQE